MTPPTPPRINCNVYYECSPFPQLHSSIFCILFLEKILEWLPKQNPSWLQWGDILSAWLLIITPSDFSVWFFLRTLLFWIYQIKFNLEFDLRCRAFRPVTWCKIKTPPQAGRMSRLLYFTLERDSDFYFFFFLIKLYRMYSEIIFMDLSYIAVLMMCCMLLSVRFNIYYIFLLAHWINIRLD